MSFFIYHLTPNKAQHDILNQQDLSYTFDGVLGMIIIAQTLEQACKMAPKFNNEHGGYTTRDIWDDPMCTCLGTSFSSQTGVVLVNEQHDTG